VYGTISYNETIESDKYCSQLDKLKVEIAKKCPKLINRKGVVFHHDNVRPHTNLQTRQKLLVFGWDVLPHPSYSPDIAPSDCHLFRSLQNSINGLNFASLELLKNYLDSFFVENRTSTRGEL